MSDKKSAFRIDYNNVINVHYAMFVYSTLKYYAYDASETHAVFTYVRTMPVYIFLSNIYENS